MATKLVLEASKNQHPCISHNQEAIKRLQNLPDILPNQLPDIYQYASKIADQMRLKIASATHPQEDPISPAAFYQLGIKTISQEIREQLLLLEKNTTLNHQSGLIRPGIIFETMRMQLPLIAAAAFTESYGYEVHYTARDHLAMTLDEPPEDCYYNNSLELGFEEINRPTKP